MKRIIILTILIAFNQQLNAQNEFNNWFFGANLAFDFSGGNPVLIAGSTMNQAEGNATVSDASGNLLFYTSGTTIWNKNHVVMTNGSGLLGHTSSTQSAIIVQKPLSTTIYYVFTADAETWPNGIRYTEVDMSLSAGFGAVTANKNILLRTPSCEKLTAVRHCNNVDVWVISHDYNSNTFRTWLVNSTGVIVTPVNSNTGYVPTSVTQQGYGYLKSNTDGSKLAAAYYGAPNSSSGNRVEIYDFNKSTGQVSNALSLGNVNGAYGVEFSASGRYLYASTNPGYLYQWDLCSSNIIGSKFQIANVGAFGGALQIAPDNKIYLVRGINKWVARINNPEVYGFGCGFVDQAIITPTNTNFGLPNFPSYYLRPRDDFIYTVNCTSVQFNALINNNSCINNVAPSLNWSLGDGTTSTINNPLHTYFSPGNYQVELIINYPCYSDTVLKTVTTGINSPFISSIVTQ
jgi:hypothetical protein